MSTNSNTDLEWLANILTLATIDLVVEQIARYKREVENGLIATFDERDQEIARIDQVRERLIAVWNEKSE
jgi:hypothetical protein